MNGIKIHSDGAEWSIEEITATDDICLFLKLKFFRTFTGALEEIVCQVWKHIYRVESRRCEINALKYVEMAYKLLLYQVAYTVSSSHTPSN